VVFAAVYMVFAFQRCPDGNITEAVALPSAAGGKMSRKRMHQDCDNSHVDDGL